MRFLGVLQDQGIASRCKIWNPPLAVGFTSPKYQKTSKFFLQNLALDFKDSNIQC